MKELKQKAKSRRGFTLAELLIVVAVIAILVSMAVPIFFGALKESRLRVNQANVRSVKGAGVAKILSDWNEYQDFTTYEHGWLVSCEFDQSGNMGELTVSPAAQNSKTATINDKEYSEEPDSEFAAQTPGYTVTVRLQTTDLGT